MKRYILILIFCLFIVPSFSQSFGVYSITTTLSKDDCMDIIDEWVALNQHSFKFSLDYKNTNTGKCIINGVINDDNSKMYSVSKGALTASIQYSIVTEACDNNCTISFNELNYCFKDGGYVDYDLIATKNLELMVDEISVVEELGETIEVNQALLNKTQSVIEEYDSLSERIKDSSLKNSERKRLEKELSKKVGMRNVYVSMGGNTNAFVTSVVSSLEKALK